MGSRLAPPISLNTQNRYEIKIFGQLDGSWLDWFGPAQAQTGTLADLGQITTYSNVTLDQAGLVGLIRRLHGQGIVILSVIGSGPAE